jgi:hypothetical protein
MIRTLSFILLRLIDSGDVRDTTVAVLKNVDTATWDVTISMIEEPDSLQFSLIGSERTVSLVPGQELSVSVRCHPTKPQGEMVHQSISLAFNGFGSPVIIPLYGNDAALDVTEESQSLNTVALSAPIPNPSETSIRFGYQLGLTGHVRITLTDEQGESVRLLMDEDREPGSYVVNADVSELPVGIYFCVLEAGTEKLIQRLIVVH